MTNTFKNPADYIFPLKINGLNGRVMRLPAKKSQNSGKIIFIYGHHSSLERWWGLAQALSNYGNVTTPDLPGFGGMDSLYKIGQKPTIDNLADYLADFIKDEYKGDQIVLAGMSFGFVIVTRMLQRHPDMCSQVKLLISIVGFAHMSDFTFSKTRYYSYLYGTRFFAHRPFSSFFRHVALSPILLRAIYSRTHNARHKFKNVSSKEEFDELIGIEIKLWHDNEVRTYMFTTSEFLKLDNTKQRVDLPVRHIAAKNDHFFDNNLVEQHMKSIFSDFHSDTAAMTNHAPSVIADEAAAAALIPPELRLVLSKL